MTCEQIGKGEEIEIVEELTNEMSRSQKNEKRYEKNAKKNLKGLSHKKFFHLNLIFWMLMR